ncbi:Spermidine synthase like protein [Argiope bruennichi]|uniref:Spermidine synthase like protein n=1 Tax=Argiope bruennichi TaxID=94029 RepID=A0A8T0FM44_ARGBR|nr:Spermidine synthase like protein [Argiope bruennichi]
MDSFKKGWFTETGTLHSDVVMSVKVNKILYHEKSKYQDILIFECDKWGRVLVLDNAVQLAEFDEFAWQETSSFVSLNSHPHPKKVLIIGGGVGGVVRECSKHPLVESIDICEIDEKVHEASKKFLPFMCKGFESTKYKLHFADGAEFVKNHPQEYDVIITDSPDPKGETFWYDLEMMAKMIKMCKTLFPVVDYGTTYIATYPAGHIGYLCCSDNPETNFRKPLHSFSRETLKKFQLKYYTPEIHRAMFALPFKMAEALGLSWEVK